MRKRFGICPLFLRTAAVLSLPALPTLGHAYYIYSDPPYCCVCETGRVCPTTNDLSLTEGNLYVRLPVATAGTAFGSAHPFALSYNSYNADGTRAAVDTVLGFGWTHSYNIFLFSQRGHMFRYDGDGRVTMYKLGSSGTFTAAAGYFETFVRNPDGTFTLRQKNGTTFKFASIPGTPFLVGGPVYMLTSITDRNGNVTTLGYTGGLLSTITDTYGRVLQLLYNAQKKLASVTDPLGRSITFTYDSSGPQLLRVTDPLGHVTHYSYNTLYQMVGSVDTDGRTNTYSYGTGKPTGKTDGAGAAVLGISNPGNWPIDETLSAPSLQRIYTPATTTQVDGRNNQWRYDYDANAYITRKIAPDGATTSFTYDPLSLMVATQTDANGRITTYQYDAGGNRTKITDPLGNVTTYAYEPTFNMMTSMTDPKGRVTTYQYDARGNRIKEIDPLLQSRTWTYDSHGNVLTQSDKRGNITRFTYDSSGNRISITAPSPLGYINRMTYDGVGNVITRTDPNLHTTTFQYDSLNRLVRRTDPAGKSDLFEYDSEGNQTRVTDRNGHVTTFQYDLRERPIKATDALGQTSTMSYDGNNNRTAETDRNGHTTTYEYDVQNRRTKITDAELNVTRFTYDPVGNLLTNTDANNHATTYQYDALNRRNRITDAESHVTTYQYDTGGSSGCGTCGATPGSSLVTQQIDGNGKVTYFKYDNLDRLTRVIQKEGDTADVIDASDAVTSYTYDPDGNNLSKTEPNGNATAYEYDVISRWTRITNAAGEATRFTYDGDNNLITKTSPNGNVSTLTYDSLERVIRVDDSIGRVVSYSYDPVGNRLSQIDGNNNATDFIYDALNRLTSITDPLARTNITQYDAVGNVIKTTDREGRITTAIYDNISRIISTTDALPSTTQYQYDGVGNLIRITDANSHATQYAYDGIDRRIRETYPNPAPNTRTFTYDAVNLISRTDQKGQTTTYTYNDLYFLLRRTYPASAADNFSYDLSGRLLSAERGGWVVTFSYDGADRIIHTTQGGRTLNYSYNIPGRARTVTYPGGRTITETTDVRRRLYRVVDASSPQPIVQYSYDVGDRVVSRAYRNPTSTGYSYNANDWIVSMNHNKGGTRIAGFGHAYDNEGIKRFEEKLSDAANSQTKSEAYQYDNAYRLIDYKVGSLQGNTVPLPATQTQYTLDLLGNWNLKTKDGIPETRSHGPASEITQIGAVPVSSDANGNTIEDGLYRYAYDEENRLTAVTRKSDNRLVGQYQYDALSGRVKKMADPGAVSSPVETRYFYDEVSVVEEQNPAGVTQATYVYGNYVDEFLTMDRGGQTFYYHQNTLWSPAAITNGAGNAVERYTYDAYGLPAVLNGAGSAVAPNAWGTPHSVIGNPGMFTGREFDEETGLYFYRARYYDPVKGRFLQRDPSGYVDGMNLYEYGASQPTTNLDPMGLEIKVAGKAVDVNSDRYKGWLKNPVYTDILDKLSNSKRPARYLSFTSMDDLEMELRLRAAFVKCMEGLSSSGCGFPKASQAIGTSAEGWVGMSFTGPDPSAGLDRFIAKKKDGGNTSTIGCHQAGFICAWIALRDAMEAQKPGSFDKKFAGRTLALDIDSRMPLDFGLNNNQKYANENIPGDFINFRNIGDYFKSRRESTKADPVRMAFGTENAVYIGGDKWCGFPFKNPFTADEVRQFMLDDYNAGHRLGKLGTPHTFEPENREKAMPIQNLRLPKRDFSLPPPQFNPPEFRPRK